MLIRHRFDFIVVFYNFRMYIQFSDVAGKDIGHNYTTIDKP